MASKVQRAAAKAVAKKQAAKQKQKQKQKQKTTSRPKPAAAPAPERTPVTPSLTPEQQQTLNEILAGIDMELLGLGHRYQEQAARTTRDAGDIVGGNYRTVTLPDGTTYNEYLGGGRLSNSGRLWAQGVASRQSTDNELAARGLSMSSIRDTALGDIETATTLARQEMLAGLNQLAAQNEGIRALLNTRRASTLANYEAMKVQNAMRQTPAPDPQPAPSPQPAPRPAAKTKAVGRVVATRAVPRRPVRRNVRPRVTPINAARRALVRPRIGGARLG